MMVIMDFSFGIITSGEDYDRIYEIISSIEKQQIKNYDIVVVVGENKYKNIKNLVHLDFDELQKSNWNEINTSGWITKKKNLITSTVKYDNVVYMHDYHVLQDDWYQKFLEFGSDWDICMNRILQHDGKRFRDWVSWDLPDKGHMWALDYDDASLSKYSYISGGFWVAKKDVMIEEPLSEKLLQNQSEDSEWSLRVRDKYNYVMNKNCVVKHNKIHKDSGFQGFADVMYGATKEIE